MSYIYDTCRILSQLFDTLLLKVSNFYDTLWNRQICPHTIIAYLNYLEKYLSSSFFHLAVITFVHLLVTVDLWNLWSLKLELAVNDRIFFIWKKSPAMVFVCTPWWVRKLVSFVGLKPTFSCSKITDLLFYSKIADLSF